MVAGAALVAIGAGVLVLGTAMAGTGAADVDSAAGLVGAVVVGAAEVDELGAGRVVPVSVR
ncbi:hypothetical protein SAMN05661080_04730 [Modestobacter sp. DSM 44400]|nr:hypothetical protein SAMN05661080_04730 [Modestobacter sp. DSM 44400]